MVGIFYILTKFIFDLKTLWTFHCQAAIFLLALPFIGKFMTDILIFLIIGIFIALLFLNIYFRVKVIKLYKTLVQNRIEFDSSHIFNNQKMETEILPKYPKFRNEIVGFAGHIKKSLSIAVVLVLLITVMGFILKSI